MVATEADTVLLLTSTLNSVPSTETILILTVQLSGTVAPCLIGVYCDDCADSAACTTLTSSWKLIELVDVTKYKTQIKYQCPSGTRFYNAAADSFTETVTIDCKWDKSWNPVSTLDDCKRKET